MRERGGGEALEGLGHLGALRQVQSAHVHVQQAEQGEDVLVVAAERPRTQDLRGGVEALQQRHHKLRRYEGGGRESEWGSKAGDQLREGESSEREREVGLGAPAWRGHGRTPR